jgi:hypothetical protein
MQLEFVDGVYRCLIPESGILKVQGKGPFYQWHRTEACFANGTDIPIVRPDEEDTFPEDVIAFWSGGSRPGGMIYDFLGTKAEAKSFQKETASGEVTPGGIRKSDK